jgi:hypothetical protein
LRQRVRDLPERVAPEIAFRREIAKRVRQSLAFRRRQLSDLKGKLFSHFRTFSVWQFAELLQLVWIASARPSPS